METSTPSQHEHTIKDKSIEQLRDLVEASSGMIVVRSSLLLAQTEIRQRIPNISQSFSEQAEELTSLDQRITEVLERKEDYGQRT